jgi:flagellum-specific ATP synthase
MTSGVTSFIRALRSCETVTRSGRVVQFYGSILESQGPDVYLGELCEIHSSSQSEPVLAEVIGFREGKVLLSPYGNLHGVHLNSEIIALGRSASIKVPTGGKGCVIDSFGNSLIDSAPIETYIDYPLYQNPSNPMDRRRISEVFETGVSCIDGFITMGKGQRLGIFAGSGVGKSTLLGMIAGNSKADINVIALIGERGREVLDFIERDLGPDGLSKTIVVAAAADQPALIRARAAYAATSIAEYYANLGLDVMLAMDSVTRFAMATREIGLAAGEVPTARGYPPSTFSALPKLLERSGSYKNGGTITAFYSVLVEGDDFNEPISDNVRAILDGHLMLTRDLAHKGQFPAINVLQSISRLQNDLLPTDIKAVLKKARLYMSLIQENKDLIDMGAYQSGRNIMLDKALEVVPKIDELLAQTPDEPRNIDVFFSKLSNYV